MTSLCEKLTKYSLFDSMFIITILKINLTLHPKGVTP